MQTVIYLYRQTTELRRNNVFCIVLTVYLDTGVQWNQLDALFIFSLFSHYTSTRFRLASSHSLGGNNVYVRQLVRVVRFNRRLR
jgi:hypothetical protein